VPIFIQCEEQVNGNNPYLESQMMMAEGSSDMVAFGLKVTRYFSQGENSMYCKK
jgi:hypothetical protein